MVMTRRDRMIGERIYCKKQVNTIFLFIKKETQIWCEIFRYEERKVRSWKLSLIKLFRSMAF